MRRWILLPVLLCAFLVQGVIIALTPPVFAQPPTRQWVETEQTRRIALVIGNADYQYGPKLKNPVNDAVAIADVLKSLDFKVILLTDATKRQIVNAFNEFGEKLTDDCIALAYYSGHGIQCEGQNYLLPVDFNARNRTEIEFEGVEMNRLLRLIDEKKSPVNIVILDACRNNPFKSFTRDSAGGLAKMDSPNGTLVAYATAPGSVADDNTEGKNGLYTTELLKHFADPGIEVERMFKLVRAGVASASGAKQRPWDESSITGSLYLVKPKAPAPVIPITPNSGTVTNTKAHLQVTVNAEHPTIKVDGKTLEDAEYVTNLAAAPKKVVKVLVTAPGYEDQLIEGVELFSGATTPLKVKLVAVPPAKPKPAPGESDVAGVSSLKAPRTLAEYKVQMASVPGGNFMMGSNDGYENEKPAHRVTLSGFQMGRTPVTVAMWREYCQATGKAMPEAPSWGWIAEHPIVNVSWEEAKAYCDWATQRLSIRVSLPTEAQWEYAARGGKDTKYPWGNALDESKLVCDKNAGGRTAPVYRSDRVFVNGYGLTDMAGNVWQWCADYFGAYSSAAETNPTGPSSGDKRVVRGGSWLYSLPGNFRCADRGQLSPVYKSYIRGFRVILPSP